MLLYLLLISVSATEATLTCSRSNGCPGSISTCVCVNAIAELVWTVTPPGGPDCTIRYDRSSQVGIFTTLCVGHRVVLDAVGYNTFEELTYNSSLNLKLEENVTVMCDSNNGLENAMLTVASNY